MKFGLFYEVQAPKPLDRDDWEPGQEALKFRESLDQIELADKVGFDYIWVAEHHFTGEYTHTSAPDVFLAGLSQRTKKIRLGTGVVQMPPGHNHPARVAERISTLDILSDGRVEFGTGQGGPNELGFFIDDLSDVKGMRIEATRECLRMMSMTPYPGYDGKYVHMPMTNVVPKPVQKPHPPVWVASVSMETTVEAAQSGMGSLALALGGPDEARERVETYWRTLRAGIQPIGQAVNLGLSSFVNAMCAKTDEEARQRERFGAQYFNYAIRRAISSTRVVPLHIHREFTAQMQATGTAVAEAPAESLANPAQGGGHDWTDPRGVLIGSPETMRRRMREFEAAGVDILTLTIQVGDRRHEDIMDCIDLIGREVAPEFLERHETTHRKWRTEQFERLNLPCPNNSTI